MDISVNGPKIYFEIPILGGIRITQTTVSLFAVTVLLMLAGYFFVLAPFEAKTLPDFASITT